MVDVEMDEGGVKKSRRIHLRKERWEKDLAKIEIYKRMGWVIYGINHAHKEPFYIMIKPVRRWKGDVWVGGES